MLHNLNPISQSLPKIHILSNQIHQSLTTQSSNPQLFFFFKIFLIINLVIAKSYSSEHCLHYHSKINEDFKTEHESFWMDQKIERWRWILWWLSSHLWMIFNWLLDGFLLDQFSFNWVWLAHFHSVHFCCIDFITIDVQYINITSIYGKDLWILLLQSPVFLFIFINCCRSTSISWCRGIFG